MKKTLVLGATENPERYAYIAANRLLEKNHEIELVGIKKGIINGNIIHNDRPFLENIHTITLYIGTKNQKEWYDYILSLKPKRIIMNPNTENDELKSLAEKQNIEVIEACTLVMLATNQY
jgi:predicted CoA-binding protein